MGTIYLDADACPVKDYVFRVAARYEVRLEVVANTPLRIPSLPGLSAISRVVPGALDAADDWIAEQAQPGDLVLTADVPLAARVIQKGVTALDFRGSTYNPNRIGDALASRDINAHLRAIGLTTSGPPAFTRNDRSKFASRLDAEVSKMRRNAARQP